MKDVVRWVDSYRRQAGVQQLNGRNYRFETAMTLGELAELLSWRTGKDARSWSRALRRLYQGQRWYLGTLDEFCTAMGIHLSFFEAA